CVHLRHRPEPQGLVELLVRRPVGQQLRLDECGWPVLPHVRRAADAQLQHRRPRQLLTGTVTMKRLQGKTSLVAGTARLALVLVTAASAAGCDSFLDVNEDPNNPQNVALELTLPGMLVAFAH